MGLLIMANRGHYTNADAVNNVVRYITRTRINEDRQKELIYYNGFGVVNYLTPAEMISQMCMGRKNTGYPCEEAGEFIMNSS